MHGMQYDRVLVVFMCFVQRLELLVQSFIFILHSFVWGCLIVCFVFLFPD